jgi:hypothetical protein
MDEFPTRFAALLESVAGKVRGLTVDRVAKVIKVGSLGLVVTTLGILALIFLLLAIHGALAIPLGDDGAYGLMALALLVGGIIMWSKRTKES